MSSFTSVAYEILKSGGTINDYNAAIIDALPYDEAREAVAKVFHDVNMRKCMKEIVDYRRMSVSGMASKLNDAMGEEFGTFYVEELTGPHGMPLRNDLKQPPQLEELEETKAEPEAPKEHTGLQRPRYTLDEDKFATVSEQLHTHGLSSDDAVPHVGLYAKAAKDFMVARVKGVFPNGFWKIAIVLTFLWGVVTHDTVYVTGPWCERMATFLKKKFGNLPNNGLTLGIHRSVAKMLMEKSQAMRGTKALLPTFVRPSVPKCEAGQRFKAMIAIKKYPVDLTDAPAFFSDKACGVHLLKWNEVRDSEPEMFGPSSAASTSSSTSTTSAPSPPPAPASAPVVNDEDVEELPADLPAEIIDELIETAMPDVEGDSSDEDTAPLLDVLAARKAAKNAAKRAAKKAAKKRKEAAAAVEVLTEERPRKQSRRILESEEDETDEEAADEAPSADEEPPPPRKRKAVGEALAEAPAPKKMMKTTAAAKEAEKAAKAARAAEKATKAAEQAAEAAAALEQKMLLEHPRLGAVSLDEFGEIRSAWELTIKLEILKENIVGCELYFPSYFREAIKPALEFTEKIAGAIGLVVEECVSDRVAYNVYFGGGSWATLYLKPHKTYKPEHVKLYLANPGEVLVVKPS